jgi:hypothetical protein
VLYQLQGYSKARPDFAEAQFLLGNAFAAGQELSDAIREFRHTVRLKRTLPKRRNIIISQFHVSLFATNLGKVLLTLKSERRSSGG